MSQITDWFTLIGEDPDSTDTDRVAELTQMGNTLLSLASRHLELMTLQTAPVETDPDFPFRDKWHFITTAMAVELYAKVGMFGLSTVNKQGFSGSLLQGYSPLVMQAVRKLVRIGNPKNNVIDIP